MYTAMKKKAEGFLASLLTSEVLSHLELRKGWCIFHFSFQSSLLSPWGVNNANATEVELGNGTSHS